MTVAAASGSWRLARSLERLRVELDDACPARSRKSDGTIGDAAHASRRSDHNPDERGVVRALDLTHDPISGADMHVLAEHIRKARHPALAYVIFSGRIASSRNDWAWREYHGVNAHRGHMHVSVAGAIDRTSTWGAGGALKAGPARRRPPTLKMGDRSSDVAFVQRFLGVPDDGIYGPQTFTAVVRYQRMRALVADGVVGPRTWSHILSGVSR